MPPKVRRVREQYQAKGLLPKAARKVAQRHVQRHPPKGK